MIKNINNLNRPILLLMALLVFFSCSKTKEYQEYSYAHYYGKDSIPSNYLVRKITNDKEGKRTVVVFFSKTKKGFKKIASEKYLIVNGGLERVLLKEEKPIIKPYLTTLHNDCIELLFDNEMDDMLATTLCYLGKEDVVIGARKYNNVFKFRKLLGLQHRVESNVYYDHNFILLKEEYVSGYADEYKIIRLEDPN